MQVNGQNPGSLGVIGLPTVVRGHRARVVCSGSPGSSQAAVNIQVQTSTPRAVERPVYSYKVRIIANSIQEK